MSQAKITAFGRLLDGVVALFLVGIGGVVAGAVALVGG
jgi:hypothetical protein